jgi:hypothetical protein
MRYDHNGKLDVHHLSKNYARQNRLKSFEVAWRIGEQNQKYFPMKK